MYKTVTYSEYIDRVPKLFCAGALVVLATNQQAPLKLVNIYIYIHKSAVARFARNNILVAQYRNLNR